MKPRTELFQEALARLEAAQDSHVSTLSDLWSAARRAEIAEAEAEIDLREAVAKATVGEIAARVTLAHGVRSAKADEIDARRKEARAKHAVECARYAVRFYLTASSEDEGGAL